MYFFCLSLFRLLVCLWWPAWWDFFPFYIVSFHLKIFNCTVLGLVNPVPYLCYLIMFLRASAMLKYVIDIGWTSVCLSVRLSVTRWYCIKTAEHIVMLSSPHDSPFIIVLCISRSSRNSDGFTRCGAAKQRWGVKMSQFSTNNLLYLRNGWR